jgi:FkbM family methyltransferase
MLINFLELIKKYDLHINGIVHIGAHECEELAIYQLAGLAKKNIIWLEANPNLVKNMKEKDPEIIIHSFAVTNNSDNIVKFNVTNNFQSSSLLQLKKHADYYPDITVTEVIEVPTIRMDDFYKRFEYNPANYNMLNMDIQGAELTALEGFGDILKNFDVVYTEVNTGELYEGCCTLKELDIYLEKFSFKRFELAMTDKEWGDAVYIKIKNEIKPKVAVHLCGGIGNQLYQLAALLAYTKKYDYTPIFDPSHTSELNSSDNVWHKFPILQKAISKDKLQNYAHYYDDMKNFNLIPKTKSNLLIHGYFNSERYFAEYTEEICALFYLCFKEFMIPDNKVVGIHVRRGDYLKATHMFNILTKEYYDKASCIVYQKPRVVVSEDIAWAKENIEASNYYHKTDYEDFGFLMSCQLGLIIANSTFSWWAAYLNPYKPKITYPLEWFQSPDMQNFQRYYVNGWTGITLKTTTGVIFYLYSLINQSVYNECCYYGLALLSENFHINGFTPEQHIMVLNNLIISCWYAKQTEFAKKCANRLIELALDNIISVEMNVRMNINFALGSDSNQILDLQKMPIYVIASEARRPEMLKRFTEQGLTPIFLNGVKAITPSFGCNMAHYNALKLAYTNGIFPFAIFEDDVKFTEQFVKVIKVPKICDAFYIGLSRWGVIDGKALGERNVIKVTNDVENCCHIKNMLAAHGIIYVNKAWVRKCIKYIKWSNKFYIPQDIGNARLMQRSNVLCYSKPGVIQDPMYKECNTETIVDMKEFL